MGRVAVVESDATAACEAGQGDVAGSARVQAQGIAGAVDGAQGDIGTAAVETGGGGECGRSQGDGGIAGAQAAGEAEAADAVGVEAVGEAQHVAGAVTQGEAAGVEEGGGAGNAVVAAEQLHVVAIGRGVEYGGDGEIAIEGDGAAIAAIEIEGGGIDTSLEGSSVGWINAKAVQWCGIAYGTSQTQHVTAESQCFCAIGAIDVAIDVHVARARAQGSGAGQRDCQCVAVDCIGKDEIGIVEQNAGSVVEGDIGCIQGQCVGIAVVAGIHRGCHIDGIGGL